MLSENYQKMVDEVGDITASELKEKLKKKLGKDFYKLEEVMLGNFSLFKAIQSPERTEAFEKVFFTKVLSGEIDINTVYGKIF
jgi:hypothetical protein